MRRIGGRRRSCSSGCRGANVEIPPFIHLSSNAETCESRRRTDSVGQFDWGGLLLKSNGGVQGTLSLFGNQASSAMVERVLNCETDKSSRYESRS